MIAMLTIIIRFRPANLNYQLKNLELSHCGPCKANYLENSQSEYKCLISIITLHQSFSIAIYIRIEPDTVTFYAQSSVYHCCTSE